MSFYITLHNFSLYLSTFPKLEVYNECLLFCYAQFVIFDTQYSKLFIKIISQTLNVFHHKQTVNQKHKPQFFFILFPMIALRR